MVVTKDQDCCRSLVCDANGIIIAEMVYRCMICANISDSIGEAQKHYRVAHMDSDELFDEKGDNEVAINGKSSDVKVEQDSDLKPKIAEIEEDDMDDFDDISYYDQCDTFDTSNIDAFEASTSLTTLNKSKNTQGNALADRGGFVTCAVCDVTKFYASVQRRYGRFTCMGCAKFFGRYLLKPRRYSCPNLGSCPLNSGPRCKACLLLACINTYQLDEKRLAIVNAFRPVRKAILSKNSDSPNSPGLISNLSGNNENLDSSSPSNEIDFDTLLPHEVVPMTISITPTPLMKQNQQIRAVGQSKQVQKKQNGGVGNRLSPFKSSVKKNWGCRKCAGCLVEDCGQCNYCRDKPKFGGPNTLKKKCILRKCLALEELKEREAAKIK